MAALGLMEQTRLGFKVTGLARRLFIAQGLYYGHQAMQKLLIAGLTAALAALVLYAAKLLPKSFPFPLALALCGVVGAGCQKILGGISIGTRTGLFFAVLAAFAAVLRLFARKHNFLHS